MKFVELSREQISELKQTLLFDRGADIDAVLAADETVSDDEVREAFGNVTFTPDYFFCSSVA